MLGGAGAAVAGAMGASHLLGVSTILFNLFRNNVLSH